MPKGVDVFVSYSSLFLGLEVMKQASFRFKRTVQPTPQLCFPLATHLSAMFAPFVIMHTAVRLAVIKYIWPHTHIILFQLISCVGYWMLKYRTMTFTFGPACRLLNMHVKWMRSEVNLAPQMEPFLNIFWTYLRCPFSKVPAENVWKEKSQTIGMGTD